jgi:protein-S-isoprenylcysteine O-methyltransferase Ste14
MIWAAFFWCIISIGAPVTARALEPRLSPRFGKWNDPLVEIAPWLHGLIWPYLALIGGVILGFDAGLYGHSLSAWIVGFIACASGLAAAALVLRKKPINDLILLGPIDALHEEPRWALYRSAAYLWVADPILSVALGVLMAFMEWLLFYTPWKAMPTTRSSAQLLRVLFSGIIFLITRNFWLTAGTQIGFLVIAGAVGQFENKGASDEA